MAADKRIYSSFFVDTFKSLSKDSWYVYSYLIALNPDKWNYSKERLVYDLKGKLGERAISNAFRELKEKNLIQGVIYKFTEGKPSTIPALQVVKCIRGNEKTFILCCDEARRRKPNTKIVFSKYEDELNYYKKKE